MKMKNNKDDQEREHDEDKTRIDKSDIFFSAQPVAYKFEFNFYEDIGEASKYFNLLRALRNATPDDTIHLYFACYGGQLDTMQIILTAMVNTHAKVVGTLDSHAASAAALLLLSCDQWNISNGSWMMFHNFAGVIGGKQHEMHANLSNITESYYTILQEVAKNFLSKKEIEDIKGGKDLYLNHIEIIKRLLARGEAKMKKTKNG